MIFYQFSQAEKDRFSLLKERLFVKDLFWRGGFVAKLREKMNARKMDFRFL